MSLRFRKRARILHNLLLNLSKSDLSLTLGGHDLTANINRKGVMGTFGLPGKGISYRTKRRIP